MKMMILDTNEVDNKNVGFSKRYRDNAAEQSDKMRRIDVCTALCITVLFGR